MQSLQSGPVQIDLNHLATLTLRVPKYLLSEGVALIFDTHQRLIPFLDISLDFQRQLVVSHLIINVSSMRNLYLFFSPTVNFLTRAKEIKDDIRGRDNAW